MHGLHARSYSFMCSFSSLIPGPFQTPVFDDLQYKNMEREVWEIWSHGVDVRWTDDRHTDGGAKP